MRRNQTNDTIFLAENEISFYLLGAFITDGTIDIRNNSFRASISSIDKDWITKIGDLIVPTAKIGKLKNTNCYRLAFTSKSIVDWLVSYGCTPNKSKTLELKKDIPKEYVVDFLRGVIDGDGSICASHITKHLKFGVKVYSRLDFYITTGSKLFGEQIHKLINPICGCKLYVKNRRQIIMNNGKIIQPTTYWSIQSGRKEVKIFLNKIYYKDNKINLARKQNIVELYCF